MSSRTSIGMVSKPPSCKYAEVRTRLKAPTPMASRRPGLATRQVRTAQKLITCIKLSSIPSPCDFIDQRRDGDKVIGIRSDGIRQRPAKNLGMEDNVAVGEEQVIGIVPGNRMSRGQRHGVRLAQPVCRKFCDVDHFKTRRMAACARPSMRHASLVGGTIVDRR